MILRYDNVIEQFIFNFELEHFKFKYYVICKIKY